MESSAPQTLKKALRLLEREGQSAKVQPTPQGYTLRVGDKSVQYDKWGRLVHDNAV